MERLVINRKRYEAETRRLFSHNQAGYRNGHRTKFLIRLAEPLVYLKEHYPPAHKT